jgi:hypothetical protein
VKTRDPHGPRKRPLSCSNCCFPPLQQSSQLPRPLLETLGLGLHSLNAVNRVKTLQDVYCDFRCQLDLFDLMVPESFNRSIGGTELGESEYYDYET